jgi:hypothetical protein
MHETTRPPRGKLGFLAYNEVAAIVCHFLSVVIDLFKSLFGLRFAPRIVAQEAACAVSDARVIELFTAQEALPQ